MQPFFCHGFIPEEPPLFTQDMNFASEPARDDIVAASPKDQANRPKFDLSEKQQGLVVTKGATLDRSPSLKASPSVVTDQQDLPLPSAVAPTDQQDGLMTDDPGSTCALSLASVMRAQTRFARRISHHGGLVHPLLPELDDAMLRQLARDIKLSVPEEAHDCSLW